MFVCPCNSLLSSSHHKCKQLFFPSAFNRSRDTIFTALSIYKSINNKLVFNYILSLNNSNKLTSFLLTLFIHYHDYFPSLSYKFKAIHYYIKLIPVFFKVSLYKGLIISSLQVNNNSTKNIDRSNINIREIKIKLQYILPYKNNIYYLKLLKSDLKDRINEYYSKSKQYHYYKLHEYEIKNKIPAPVTSYTGSNISSVPDYVPSKNSLFVYHQFILDTDNYLLTLPQSPDGYDPFDIEHTYKLDRYFENVVIDYDNAPPVVTYDEVVTQREKLFPNKKYLLYERYKDVVCYFCNKKGHISTFCEDIVIIDNIKDPLLKRLAVFVFNYPKCVIDQQYGSYTDCIYNLPDIYDKLWVLRNKFWSDFGFGNPFLDFNKYWSFGDYRRRDVGFWWAIGSSRVYLLKLIAGYDSKYCMPLPRMKLQNHKSFIEHSKEALPVLHEYIELGILKIIPASAARVILPMGLIIKPNKVRIVIDGKPINMYIPPMRFKPAKVQEVKTTVFQNARVLTQDAKHAFYQLKVTPEQALNQCVQFYYPPLGRIITCCFTTEFFGSKNSCYRYVKLDSQINRYFRKCGIIMNDFYDDAVFYSQNSILCAGILGGFIKRIYYGCGRILNEHKTDLLKGSYTYPFCGFNWNTCLMKFSPLEKLIKTTIEAIDYVISNINKKIFITSFVKVIGKLVFAGIAIIEMSVLLIPLKEVMRDLHSIYGQDEIWLKRMLITSDICDNMLYLRKLLLEHHIVPIVIKSWDLDIVSDVSDRMAGSHDSDGNIVTVPLTESLCTSSSCLRETYGIFVALVNRLPYIKGKKIRLIVDNLGTVTILMRNGSKKYQLNQLVYTIRRLCMDNGITLWIRWLRRDNIAVQFADDLSKCVEVDRWIFDPDILSYIINKLSLPYITLDMLADNKNRLCTNYISRFFDGYSLGFNWMRYDSGFFSNYIGFLNPPFRGDYLEVAVDHILTKEINCYVILPVWTAAAWFRRVMMHYSILIEIPDGTNYFKSPGYMTLRATKKWDVILVYFDFESILEKRQYKLNVFSMSLHPIKTKSSQYNKNNTMYLDYG